MRSTLIKSMTWYNSLIYFLSSPPPPSKKASCFFSSPTFKATITTFPFFSSSKLELHHYPLPRFLRVSPRTAPTSRLFPRISPFLRFSLVNLQRGDRDHTDPDSSRSTLAHTRDSLGRHDQRAVERLDRPGGVQHASRALSGAHRAPREVLRVHARVLEHRLHALPQGGAVLLHVPRRVVAGGEGEEGRDPPAAVHRVPSRGHHAVLLGLRPPVRGHRGGRADGDSGRERRGWRGE